MRVTVDVEPFSEYFITYSVLSSFTVTSAPTGSGYDKSNSLLVAANSVSPIGVDTVTVLFTLS